MEPKRCRHCQKKMRWRKASCKVCRGQCHRRCARNAKACDCRQEEPGTVHPKLARRYLSEKLVQPFKNESCIRSRSFSDGAAKKKNVQIQHSLDIYDRKPSLFGGFLRRRHSFSFAFQSRDDFNMYQSCCKADLIRILKDHREVVGVSQLNPTEEEEEAPTDVQPNRCQEADIGEVKTVAETSESIPDDTFDEPDTVSSSISCPHDSVPLSLAEWTIPIKDIDFGDEISQCRSGTVYRGRWHGEVSIYRRHNTTTDSYSRFLEEVSTLSLIRHENIVLFMGASTDPSKLAIVTSCVKARTLHTQIFLRQHPIGFETSLAIAKQIAQGLGYLHAKGIAIGDFCSRNIFLDSRVKVAMTDCMWRQLPTPKHHFGFASSGHLSYFSPEQMRCLHVGPQSILLSEVPTTCPSNMFAYGTVLYELFCGSHPFEGMLPEQVVWQLCSGRSASLQRFGNHTLIKDITSSCWAACTSQRLSCEEVLAKLKKLRIPKLLLQRQLSLSEPEDIDKMATFRFKNRSP